MQVDQPTPAQESAAPVEASSQPAAPSETVSLDTTGLSPEVAQALQAAYGNVTTDAPPAPSEPAAEPATEVVPEAVQEPETEGDDEPVAAAEADSTEPKLSRAQRAEQKRTDDINAAVSAAMVARDAQRLAEDALAEKTSAEQQVMAQAAALLDTAAQENELIDKVAAGDFEAADQLKVLRELKKRDAVILTAADKMAWSKVYTQVQTAKAIKGVDPTVIDSVGTLTEVFAHVEAAVEKRVKADYEGRLERQKADYESRLGRAASQLPTTETGGRAVGASSLPTLSEVQVMFRTGNWQAFAGREAEIMAAYQSGRLK